MLPRLRSSLPHWHGVLPWLVLGTGAAIRAMIGTGLQFSYARANAMREAMIAPTRRSNCRSSPTHGATKSSIACASSPAHRCRTGSRRRRATRRLRRGDEPRAGSGVASAMTRLGLRHRLITDLSPRPRRRQRRPPPCPTMLLLRRCDARAVPGHPPTGDTVTCRGGAACCRRPNPNRSNSDTYCKAAATEALADA